MTLMNALIAAWLGLWALAPNQVEVHAQAVDPHPVIVAGRDWLGQPNRLVRPYPDDVTLVKVSITNRGPSPYRLPEMVLENGDKRQSPLPFAWFQRRWPAEAATRSVTMLDRTKAIAYILCTRLEAEEVLPGQTVEGLVAFEGRSRSGGRLWLGELGIALGGQP